MDVIDVQETSLGVEVREILECEVYQSLHLRVLACNWLFLLAYTQSVIH